MIYFKLGLRNLFRNKRRTILSALAIGVGLGALIITDGFVIGITQNMIKMATSNLMGQAQIHNKKFKENNDVEHTINDLASMEDLIKKQQSIKHWSKRVLAQGMVASARSSMNVSVYGLLPNMERAVTNIHKYLIKGSFLENEKTVLLGSVLMADLEVDLGDKLVITVTNIKTGDLSQELFRVSGVIHFGSKEMDRRMVFIPLKDAQQMLGVGNQVHEIVLDLGSEKIAQNNDLPLWRELSVFGNIAEGWPKIMPSLSSVIEMTSYSMAIMGVILMILVSLGIVNTLFMSIFERLFEFGVLRAIGTESKGIFLMILFEAFSLGGLSSFLGIILAIIFGGWMALVGVDYGGIEFNEVTFREPIYFIFQWYQFTIFPLVTILFTGLIGIYPAYSATKITLGKALKKSL